MKFLKSISLLKLVGLLFLLLYSFLVVLYYQSTKEYAIEQTNKRLKTILIQHKAMHKYIENIQKPVIYELKSQKKLYSEFFSPNLLSFTFIARNIHRINREISQQEGLYPYTYKLASDNPRNELNNVSLV